MCLPSRTGGILSPKPDLWYVSTMIPKRFQKASKTAPQKCPKRYVYCRFCDFAAFPIYSKKVLKRFRKGYQNDYQRVPKNDQNEMPQKIQNVIPVKDRRHFEPQVGSEKCVNNDPKNVPKRFPKKWPKRYAHCRFGDFRDPQNLSGTSSFIGLKVSETLRILSFRWFRTK